MSETDTTEFSIEVPGHVPRPLSYVEGPFDVFVKDGTNSRLIKMAVVGESKYAVTFSIEGGFPATWYDDELLTALAEKLGENMYRDAEFLHAEPQHL